MLYAKHLPALFWFHWEGGMAVAIVCSTYVGASISHAMLPMHRPLPSQQLFSFGVNIRWTQLIGNGAAIIYCEPDQTPSPTLLSRGTDSQ